MHTEYFLLTVDVTVPVPVTLIVPAQTCGKSRPAPVRNPSQVETGFDILAPSGVEINPQFYRGKKDIGEILWTLCKQKNVEILEAEACIDHIHMLVSIPPYLSVAQFMGFLKGKSSLMIFDRHANLKYKYGSRNFWCRGYYVDTVGRNKKIIAEYIRNQLEEDYAADQISIKEYVDPFTGDKNKKA